MYKAKNLQTAKFKKSNKTKQECIEINKILQRNLMGGALSSCEVHEQPRFQLESWRDDSSVEAIQTFQ